MIEHRSACNLVHWGSQICPANRARRVVAEGAVQFRQFGVGDLLAAVLPGMRLVLARPDGNRDSAYLVQVIREHK